VKFTLSIAFCDSPALRAPRPRGRSGGVGFVSALDGLFFYETAEYAYPVAETGAPYWTGSTP